jgi:hypothetical protein
VVDGNYIDNCWIEWSNEHDPEPEQDSEFSFGGLTLTANTFMCTGVAASFRWLVVRPRGPGHYLNGLAVMGNVFRVVNANVDRIEKVDASQSGLDHARARNVVFSGNVFHGVTQPCMNPVTLSHTQNTQAATWTVDFGAWLPFGGQALTVVSVLPEGPLRNSANVITFAAPYAEPRQGGGLDRVDLKWPQDLRGKVQVTLRSDSPV